MAHIGLYYPFIHFKDERWLKTVALYWDSVKRIVPSGYELHDSETVKKLQGELNLIENVPPTGPDDEWPVRDPFVQFLTSNAEALRKRYGVENRDKWPEDPISAKWAPPGSDTRLAYVHVEKTWPELKTTLTGTGLAEVGRADDDKWIGMHPKVADVYMTALTEHMASGRGWCPITDETLDQLAVSGFSIERMARALLEDEQLVGDQATEQEMQVTLANVCLETVIPKNVADVPVEKIIELRKQHRAELTAFQQYLTAFRKEATQLDKVTDRDALLEHLQSHYTKTMEPSVKEVREAFKIMKLESATSVLNVNATLPPLAIPVAAKLGVAIDPVIGGLTGVALALIPIVQKRRDDARAAEARPGAWLVRVEEGLKPDTFLSWVRKGARRFVLGV